MDLVGDVLGTVSVDQGVPGLLPVHVSRTDVGDHDGVTVSVQRVLQEPAGGAQVSGVSRGAGGLTW